MEEPTYQEKIRFLRLRMLWIKLAPSFTWIFIISMGIVVGVVILALLLGLLIPGFFEDSSSTDSVSNSQSDTTSDYADTANIDCSVKGINIHGTLLTYIPYHSDNDTFFDYDVVASEDVTWAIEQANKDPKIKAIVVEVDSGGGSPVAGEEISNAIKNSTKPVVVFIRGMGASSAYWAISSANKIFASKNSDVGSIGVTSSYISNVIKNGKDGYTYEQLNAGRFKDSGSPDKPLTVEERTLFLRDINIIYENFIEAVSQNRGLSIAEVRSIADGSTVLGEKAKSLGLIDSIGDIYTVEKYLQETIGEKPEICWQ